MPPYSEGAQCPECGFAWSITRDEAINLVHASPRRYDEALAGSDPQVPIRPGLWSPLQYLWHMVDVLRIGTERLWTLLLDPDAGVPCWDENELARVRRYADLSPVVGLFAYAQAVEEWVNAAYDVPAEAETHHPEFGTITALDVIRRNAHEAEHHLRDIARTPPKDLWMVVTPTVTPDVDRLVQVARLLPPPKGNYLETDFVTNLLATVVDFQQHSKTVENALQHYDAHLHDQVRTMDDVERFMAAYPNDKAGNTALAKALWGYKFWTRAEMLRGLVAFFDGVGVRDHEALRSWAAKADFKRDFQGRVRGLGLAVFQWLVMRQGIETVKPDVHVRRFAERAVGRTLSDDEIIGLVVEAAKVLGIKAYELDWAIWEHERGL